MKKLFDIQLKEAERVSDVKRENDKKEYDATREKDKKESDAKREEDKQEYDAKIAELEATLNSLKSKAPKRAAGNNSYVPAAKQPRLNWLKKDHPELPKNIFFKNGTFGYKKTMQGRNVYKSGFQSIAEAKAGLALCINGGPSRDIGEMMGGR